MSGPVLELDRVSKSFGAFRAVSKVSVALEKGEILGLIGPNGAGKSTLLNLASGALHPTSGDIRYHGRSIAGAHPHALVHRGIARSFQITAIFPRLTVVENVRIALMARRGLCRDFLRPAGKMLKTEIATLLERVRMSDRAERYAGELAAGDRKRLEFAIALAGDPSVVLLDEPTAGMSGAERAVVVEVIMDLNAREGVSLLFTEHDIDMVFAIAQRIVVLHQGEKIADGAPTEVRASPRVQEVYLGEAANA
ncbi:ABC transporter ATP-binding protein [Pikeienuella piscinae]|uniref:ABC transporter ATP-binding protein n=1 Tax=Pikeienuella piscinae TaxID=2748098 RepID=A0A7L5C381_9RHOB|nr:ABC transporter ATP-binding protein [Pikeienuella piscinae]QIE56704.1 ABC transporter ATP-binding protein [Pikeienuella piscinae]